MRREDKRDRKDTGSRTVEIGGRQKSVAVNIGPLASL
jgi:hypothetical protein